MPKFVEVNIFDRTIINLKKFIASTKRFIELSDTPSSYAGQGSKTISVNAAETGVEFGRRLYVSDSSPTAGDGEEGDIWFEY